jgi:hypothetical protein
MAAKQTIMPWMLRTKALRVSKKHVRRMLKAKGFRESSGHKADRLARSTRDLLNTLATITDKNAGFRSIADPNHRYYLAPWSLDYCGPWGSS